MHPAIGPVDVSALFACWYGHRSREIGNAYEYRSPEDTKEWNYEKQCNPIRIKSEDDTRKS